jgi:hypothetical protein
MLTKPERLAEIFRRLKNAEPAGARDEAFELVKKIIDAVEDEYADTPYAPEKWENDGRMYMPMPDNEREVEGRPDQRRYRSRKHNIFIGDDGSIEIWEVKGECLLNKAGKAKLKPP